MPRSRFPSALVVLRPRCRKGYEMAVQALDIALGRGGDQAAVRAKRALIFTAAFPAVWRGSEGEKPHHCGGAKDLIAQSSDVLIMGHKSSDLDAVGASIGMLRFCRICRKPACIVVNEERSLAANLIEKSFVKGGQGNGLYFAG